MKRLLFITLLFPILGIAQEIGFPFGQVTFQELGMTDYPNDTTAIALVLNEFGESRIDNQNDHNLIFRHHYKIKILKLDGKEEANISIPLYKNKERQEKLLSIRASSFNIVDQKITESPVDKKDMFLENRHINMDLKKLTIPNVTVGSVIEVEYVLETPFFVRNFRSWEFQSHLPKLKSEYWAYIPANYNYNISLRGFLKLAKNESKLIKECFQPGGGNKADCSLLMYAMKNIPAFKEEEYMTAKSNFISSINFELMELKHFSGYTDKVTTEWKDADLEMKKDPKFGLQLKKGKDIKQQIEPLIAGIVDPYEKAVKVYEFIQSWYRWNEYYGKYSELGIKKAFDTKTGNIGDINLSLIAALDYAGLDVEPMVLSTRKNGLPLELFPVLSDFNYVVAKLNLKDKIYLLDASDPLLPFGLLPERCLNGKGRVFGNGPSYWHPITPADKEKSIISIILNLSIDGTISGTIENTFSGYKAYYQRKKILSFNSEQDYLNSVEKRINEGKITAYSINGLREIQSPIKEKFNVEINAFDNPNAKHFILNPFIIEKFEQNPFKSPDRLYPVDFGAPLETTVVFNLNFPEEFELTELPESAGLTLPNAGGKFIFNIDSRGNSMSLSYMLSINKTVFTATEYHYLRELFARIIQIQNFDLIFKRKN